MKINNVNMKRIKLALILALAATALTSCDMFGPIIPITTKQYYYFLHINFQDQNGNELIAPFAEDRFKTTPGSVWYGEIDTLKYTLSITPEKPGIADDTRLNYLAPMRMSSQDAVYWNSQRPGITMTKYNEEYVIIAPSSEGTFGPEGTWFLDFHNSVATTTTNEQDYLTYKLSCPVVFGDNSVHEFKAYWSKGQDKSYIEFYPSCTKVVFDGKEYVPATGVTYLDGNGSTYISYFVTITLDRADIVPFN